MDVSNLNRIYFIGIGGIGMSALARYFNNKGAAVYGYDRVVTAISRELEKEDMVINTGSKSQIREFYYAVVNGLYLGTTKDIDMFFLVDDVLSGQPLEKNLGNLFKNPEAALQFRIDLTPGLVMVAGKLRSSRPDLADTINSEVAAGELRAIRGIINIGGGQIVLRLNLPVTTIGRWISMYGILQQAQATPSDQGH